MDRPRAAALTALAALAARQRGLMTRAQALDAGLTPAQIAWCVRAHRFQVVAPAVYAFAGTPRSWEQVVLASLFAAGGGAVASHETAARLFGLRGPEAEAIELTTERSQRVRLAGVRAHQTMVLFDADVTRRSGIACTSAARLVVDLSRRRTPAELGRVADELQRRGALRLPALAQCAARLRWGPGRSLRRVDELLLARWPGYDPGDSDLESRVVRAVHAAGLPLPKQQVRIRIGGGRYYLDLAYPEILLAVEIDSWAYHRFRAAFDGDRAKGNDLVLLGWHVLRISDAMSDAEIVALFRAALLALCHPAVA